MSLVEDNLSEKIAKNVAKCIKLFGVKSENLIATGPDASQVIGKNLNLLMPNSHHHKL